MNVYYTVEFFSFLFLLYLSWSIVGDPSWPYSLFWSTSSDQASILLPWEKWNKAQRNKFPRTTWSSHLKCLKPYFKNWNEHSKMRSCDTLYPERQLTQHTKIKKKKPKWIEKRKIRASSLSSLINFKSHYHDFCVFPFLFFYPFVATTLKEKKNPCNLSSMHITWSKKKCCVFFTPIVPLMLKIPSLQNPATI